MSDRCSHRYMDGYVQCCLDGGHTEPHRYRCANEECPGYAYPASVLPHPPHTCLGKPAEQPDTETEE